MLTCLLISFISTLVIIHVNGSSIESVNATSSSSSSSSSNSNASSSGMTVNTGNADEGVAMAVAQREQWTVKQMVNAAQSGQRLTVTTDVHDHKGAVSGQTNGGTDRGSSQGQSTNGGGSGITSGSTSGNIGVNDGREGLPTAPQGSSDSNNITRTLLYNRTKQRMLNQRAAITKVIRQRKIAQRHAWEELAQRYLVGQHKWRRHVEALELEDDQAERFECGGPGGLTATRSTRNNSNNQTDRATGGDRGGGYRGDYSYASSSASHSRSAQGTRGVILPLPTPHSLPFSTPPILLHTFTPFLTYYYHF